MAVNAERVCEALNTKTNSIRQAHLACKWVERAYGMEHGMEWVDLPNGTGVWYVNRGDTYDATLCKVTDMATGSFDWIVASWGGLFEEAERERYDDTGEQSCCNCGEYAECEEHSGKNWDGYACESCREEVIDNNGRGR